jgi:hypothetical protein
MHHGAFLCKVPLILVALLVALRYGWIETALASCKSLGSAGAKMLERPVRKLLRA